MTNEIATSIAHRIVWQVALAPIQGLAIYAALKIMKKVRIYLSKLSWGIFENK